MKSICIEGWRGINHSYSLVNQYQILSLSKLDFALHHRDMPFFRDDWNATENDSGLSRQNKEIINSLLPYSPLQKYDVTYRIDFPYRFEPSSSEKLFVFGTCEYQNLTMEMVDSSNNNQIQDSLKVITPSYWSKQGFLKVGLREEQVLVIPHGVDREVYTPPSNAIRQSCRNSFGINKNDFMILSLGAMTNNKGIDVLILAFSLLVDKYPHIILVLKDSSNLYGIKAQNVVNKAINKYNIIPSDQFLNSIKLISANLSSTELKDVYGSADCYVSPYRAEGFNLPPLEAAACGTPIVVTEGGSTDDYFNESMGLKIHSKLISEGDNNHLEPDVDSLVNALTMLIEGSATPINKNIAQDYIDGQFSWDKVVSKLVGAFEN